jgi:hypothetical protein
METSFYIDKNLKSNMSLQLHPSPYISLVDKVASLVNSAESYIGELFFMKQKAREWPQLPTHRGHTTDGGAIKAPYFTNLMYVLCISGFVNVDGTAVLDSPYGS